MLADSFLSPFGLVARWHTGTTTHPDLSLINETPFISNILLTTPRVGELILYLSPSLSEDDRKLGVPVTNTTVSHPLHT